MTTSLEWYDMVNDFHERFGHPISGPKGNVLEETRRAARGSWMIEELMEFISSKDLVDQVDALLDFMYFCWGNFIELGSMASGLEDEFREATTYPREMEFPHRVSFAAKAASHAFDFMHSDKLEGQRDFTGDAIRIALRALRVMNVDPRGLMDIVHDSNMGKLWADGKPRYTDDSKILKPGTWISPRKPLEKELNKRFLFWMAKEEKNDELPF